MEHNVFHLIEVHQDRFVTPISSLGFSVAFGINLISTTKQRKVLVTCMLHVSWYLSYTFRFPLRDDSSSLAERVCAQESSVFFFVIVINAIRRYELAKAWSRPVKCKQEKWKHRRRTGGSHYFRRYARLILLSAHSNPAQLFD